MYSLRQMKRIVRNPALGLIELNRIYHRRLRLWDYNEKGIDIFERDWDNLIILDACRYDMFAEEATLPGETQKVHSRGTSTIEFLLGNFDGRNLLDTVYVNANPQLHQHREQIDTTFHAENHVWKEGGWDEEKGTVLPETMTEYAVEAATQFPNKRLIFHYLQPHQPFIKGDTQFDMQEIAKSANDPLEFWDQVKNQTIDLPKHELWNAYVENLHTVLPYVYKLMESVKGKTVVTADHGEMIDEKASPLPINLTGHPQGIYIPPLVEVPWHIYEDGSRRTVEAGAPQETIHNVDDVSAKERLKDLGYVT